MRFTEALPHLQAAITTSGEDFAYYRLDAKRRTGIIQSKSAQWDNAKRSFIEVIRLCKVQGDHLIYHQFEMMGELAYINWATGNKTRACAAMFGLVIKLASREDTTEPRFREVFSKTLHALGLLASLATFGQTAQDVTENQSFQPLEAGLFGILRESLGNHTPKVGFSKRFLLTTLARLAITLNMFRTAWKVFSIADTLLEKDFSGVYVEPIFGERVFLATQFAHPTRVMELALEAAKLVAVTKRLYDTKTRTLESLLEWESTDLQEDWMRLSSQERKNVERLVLLYRVFGPLFTHWLGTDASKEQIVDQLATWEQVVKTSQELLEDGAFWIGVIEFFKSLSTQWTDRTINIHDSDIPENDSLLRSLYYLFSSRQENRNLVQSIVRQASAVDYLLRYKDRYSFFDIGMFLHRFWLDVATTRGFTLKQPQLFRAGLFSVSHKQGRATSIKVLMLASRAVGKTLPTEVMTRFREVERLEY